MAAKGSVHLGSYAARNARLRLRASGAIFLRLPVGNFARVLRENRRNRSRCPDPIARSNRDRDFRNRLINVSVITLRNLPSSLCQYIFF